MKFLIDMNLSPLWVPFLSSNGFDAVHWSTVGHFAAPDLEILEYSVAHGYVVFTHDLDFGMLLAASKGTRPSVLQMRSQDVLPSAMGAAVLRAIQAAQMHLEQGALVTLDSSRERIRILPI